MKKGSLRLNLGKENKSRFFKRKTINKGLNPAIKTTLAAKKMSHNREIQTSLNTVSPMQWNSPSSVRRKSLLKRNKKSRICKSCSKNSRKYCQRRILRRISKLRSRHSRSIKRPKRIIMHK